MKRKMLKEKGFSIMLILIIFLPIVKGMNLGTVTKKNYAQVRKGQTAKFIVLFWNTENSSFPVKLDVKEIPDKWIVIIRPDEFILNQSKPESPPYEEDAEYLNIQNNIIKTIPVEVLVKTPRSAKPGENEVILNVTTGKTKEGISVLMEKNIKLRVDIEKGPWRDDDEGSSLQSLNENIKEKLTGMASTVAEQNNTLLIFVSVVTVIGVSWTIKRRL